MDRYGNTYFHFLRDGIMSQNVNVNILHLSGQHLIKAVVNGDNYSVYADGNLINTWITDEFPSGQVALFETYLGGKFDNAKLVPIPATLLLLGSGLLGLAGLRRFRKS
jgi:hypothetical protein